MDLLPGVRNVMMRKLGDMDQTVLMNSQIDKRAEVRDVRHRAFQFHPFLQIGDLPDVIPVLRDCERFSGILCGLE